MSVQCNHVTGVQGQICAPCLNLLHREIATDDELLAERYKFIEELETIVGECERHGSQCMPSIVDKVKRLKIDRDDARRIAIEMASIVGPGHGPRMTMPWEDDYISPSQSWPHTSGCAFGRGGDCDCEGQL